MQSPQKIILTLFLIFLVAVFSYAQVHRVEQDIVDSLIFSKTREAITNLPNAMFEKHTFKQDENLLPYRLLLPKNFNKHKKYPVVISLHNSSRIGNDNEKQLEHLAKIWTRPEIYNTYNAIVVVPQFNTRSSLYSKDESGLLISKPSADVPLVLALLDQIESNFNVDKSSIYLVGYSMGASTAQNLLNLCPEKFAALVSIAAVPDLSNIKAWKNKSILLIHGAADTDNPYHGSEVLYATLGRNKKLSFKSYSNLNHHNITIPLLLTDEIPNWLFKQRK